MVDYSEIPEIVFWKMLSSLNHGEIIKLEQVCTRWKLIVSMFWRSNTELNLTKFLYPLDFPRNDPIAYRLRDRKLEVILGKVQTHLHKLILADLPPFGSIQSFAAKFEMTPRSLRIIAGCKNLRVLDLSHHFFTDEFSLSHLCLLPVWLESIRLENCRLDRAIGLNLTKVLNMEKSELLPADRGNLSAAEIVLTKLLSCHPQLSSLSLRGTCYGFFAISECFLSCATNSLKHLDLSGSYVAKIRSLKFCAKLNKLSSLHLERADITDDELAWLPECLEELSLAYCGRLVDFGCGLRSLTRLKHLRLDGNRDNFLDDHLLAICQQSPDLEYLSLENCARLTDIGLVRIARLLNLQYLSLTAVKLVSDVSLHSIVQGCKRLLTVCIRYCPMVSKCSLWAVGSLPELVEFSFSGNPNADDELIQFLISDESNVKVIDAMGCTQVKAGVRKVKGGLTMTSDAKLGPYTFKGLILPPIPVPTN